MYGYLKKAAAMVAVVLVVLPGIASADIIVSMDGRGAPSTHGFGALGMYIGRYNSSGSSFAGSTLNAAANNFIWDGMPGTINEITGDFTIQGQQERVLNGEIWDVTINLTDVEYRNPDGTYRDGGNYLGGISFDQLTDLSNGIDPFTGVDHSADSTFGFEWKALTMELDHGGVSSYPETGWTGLSMPIPWGHFNVAEMHYDAGPGLVFDAWYQNLETDKWWAEVGDTKANVEFDRGTITMVPEPGTLLLLGMGGAFLARKKQKHARARRSVA